MCRGKSMLAPPVMVVVFVFDKKISRSIEASMTADQIPKGNYGRRLESATVTKSLSKDWEWNEVNPISEKPKFGRGTGTIESKRCAGRL